QKTVPRTVFGLEAGAFGPQFAAVIQQPRIPARKASGRSEHGNDDALARARRQFHHHLARLPASGALAGQFDYANEWRTVIGDFKRYRKPAGLLDRIVVADEHVKLERRARRSDAAADQETTTDPAQPKTE